MADKPYVSPSKLKRFFIGLLGEKLNTKEPVFSEDEYSFSDTSLSPEISYWFALSDEEISEVNRTIPEVNIGCEVIVQVENKKRTILYIKF